MKSPCAEQSQITASAAFQMKLQMRGARPPALHMLTGISESPAGCRESLRSLCCTPGRSEFTHGSSTFVRLEVAGGSPPFGVVVGSRTPNCANHWTEVAGRRCCLALERYAVRDAVVSDAHLLFSHRILLANFIRAGADHCRQRGALVNVRCGIQGREHEQ
jgi:hypothetical protein